MALREKRGEDGGQGGFAGRGRAAEGNDDGAGNCCGIGSRYGFRKVWRPMRGEGRGKGHIDEGERRDGIIGGRESEKGRKAK